MRLSKQWGVAAVVLAIGAGACGDSATGALSDGEKQALTTALTTADPTFGGFAAFAVDAIGETGKLSAAASAAVARTIDQAVRLSLNGIAATEYDGVGFAIDYTVTSGGETTQFWFLGVVGWNGLTESTVTEMVVVGGFGFDEALPASATGIIEDGEVFATYLNAGALYFAISGTGSITGSSFGGSSTDCGSGTDQGVTVECSYQTGSMNGDFDFEAEDEAGTGTYSQASTEFASLPAVRLVLTATVN
jgi:hypothetical protein